MSCRDIWGEGESSWILASFGKKEEEGSSVKKD